MMVTASIEFRKNRKNCKPDTVPSGVDHIHETRLSGKPRILVRTFVAGGAQLGCMPQSRYVFMTMNPIRMWITDPMRIKGMAFSFFIALTIPKTGQIDFRAPWK